MKIKVFSIAVLLFFCSIPCLKAEVSLEEVVQAGGFAFYRDHADPHKYYYVPGEPRLAMKRDGTPEFTFIKYSKTGGDIKGGIVHFLVTWGLSDGELMSAGSALQMIDPQAKVSGPVPFKEGSFKIVSATAGEGGLFNVKVCGEGKAPIMPNQKAAVSIALTQEGATLLWESFKNPTSDVSVMFMMKYTGITPAYQAKLKVDWDKVYTHHEIGLQAKGTIQMVQLQADVKAILDELRQKGAIQLEVVGENENMQKLLEVAYNHLIKLMCDTQMIPGGSGQGGASERESRSNPSPRRQSYRMPDEGIFDWIRAIVKAVLNPGNVLAFNRFSVYETTAHNMSAASMLSPADLFALSFTGNPSYPPDDDTEICSQERRNSARLAAQRADTLLQSRRYKQAADEYARAHEICPDPQYLFTQADINYEHLYAYRDARDQYEQAIERARSLHLYSDLIERAEDRSRRISDAIASFNEGVNHSDEGRYREAITAFERANELAPHPITVFNTAMTYYNMGRQSRSREDFENSRRIFQRMLDSLDTVPNYESRDRDRADAEETLREIDGILSSGRLPDGQELRRPGETGEPSSTAQTETRTGQEERRPPESTTSTVQRERSTTPTPPSRPSSTSRPSTSEGKAPSSTTPPASERRPTTPRSRTEGKAPSGKGVSGAPVAPRPEAPIQIKVAYTFKRVKLSGHYEVDLRQRLREEREMVMSGNISGVFQKYSEDKRFFSVVSLDDPVFQERTIEVILDGQDFSDFKTYINSVSVIFKKQRWGKDPTTGEVKFFDEQFAQKGNILRYTYGREGEGSTEWLDYEYKPKWSFYGGIEWEGPWMKASDPVLTLSPPARYRTIQISVDQDNLLQNGIRAVAFQIKHQILGKDVLKEIIIDYAKGDPLEAEYRYLHEEGKLGYSYKMIWLFMDGREVQSQWMNKESPFIYAMYTK